jgi:predicted HTH domain antitoxin
MLLSVSPAPFQAESVSVENRRLPKYDFTMMTNLSIPREIFESSRMTESEMKVELAVMLYGKGRLSIGKARELAGMSLWQFRQLLSLRGIAVHLDSEDFDAEVAAVKDLGLS